MDKLDDKPIAQAFTSAVFFVMFVLAANYLFGWRLAPVQYVFLVVTAVFIGGITYRQKSRRSA